MGSIVVCDLINMANYRPYYMTIITAIIKPCKGGVYLIHYYPLWETMAKKGITIYMLRRRYRIGHSTIQRLQRNESVTTFTLDKLCAILDAKIEEIIVFIPDEAEVNNMAK